MLPGPPPTRAYKGDRGAGAPPGSPPPPRPRPGPRPSPPPLRPRPGPGQRVWPRGQGAPCRASGRTPSAPAPHGPCVGLGVEWAVSAFAISHSWSSPAPSTSRPPRCIPPPLSPGARALIPVSAGVVFIFGSNFVLCLSGTPDLFAPLCVSVSVSVYLWFFSFCIVFWISVSIHHCPPVSDSLSWPLSSPPQTRPLASSSLPCPCIVSLARAGGNQGRPRRGGFWRGASAGQELFPLFPLERKGCPSWSIRT